MFKVLILLLSFLSLPSFGQVGFGSFSIVPNFGGASMPSLISSNLALHWVYTDLVTNTLVSIWTDELQQGNLTNSVQQPFVTTNGVYFSTNAFLWTTNLTDAKFAAFPGTVSMALIYQYPPVSLGTSGFQFNDSTPFSTFQNNAGGITQWRVFENGTGSFNVTGQQPTNTIIDWTSGKLATSNIVYTNGVVDTVGGAGGSGGGGAIPSLDCVYMGQPGTPNSFYLLEMLLWTNQQTTAVLASNLTYYRRSKYGGQ